VTTKETERMRKKKEVMPKWARDQGRRKFKYVIETDDEIQRTVEASFGHDPRVSSFAPAVRVEDGMVTLQGTVSNLKAKTAAAQDTRDTVGVSWVDNLLKVRPSKPSSDADAEKDLKAALRWNPLLDGCQIEAAVIKRAFFWSPFVDRDDITVTVHDGVVMLRGLVDGWLAYGEADRDAYKGGAVDVVNRLEVKRGAWF